MKKVLISTILSIAAFNAIAADAPVVSLHGRMDTQYTTVHEKKFKNSNPSNPERGAALNTSAIVNDTKLDINIDGKIDNNRTYGGFIRLHSDTSAATNDETSIGDKTMVYYQDNRIGRIEAGNMPGAAAMFEMDVSNFNHGAWGVDGFSSKHIQDRTIQTSQRLNKDLGGVSGANINAVRQQKFGKFSVLETRGLEFITYANLPSNYSGNHYSDAPKINLFTKPLTGLTLGLAIIPDMDSTGTIKGQSTTNGGPTFDEKRSNNPATFKEIYSAGVMYDKKFNKDWSLKTVLAGETGRAKTAGIRDLRAYEAGFMAGYQNYKFGMTYGSWTKSLTLKQKNQGTKQGSGYWTAGFSQDINKFGYAITYLNSRKAGGIESLTQRTKDGLNATGNASAQFIASQMGKDFFSDNAYNKFQNVALDVDYKLAPGFLPYATVSAFKFKEGGGTKSNGRVAIIGTRLMF